MKAALVVIDASVVIVDDRHRSRQENSLVVETVSSNHSATTGPVTAREMVAAARQHSEGSLTAREIVAAAR